MSDLTAGLIVALLYLVGGVLVVAIGMTLRERAASQVRKVERALRVELPPDLVPVFSWAELVLSVLLWPVVLACLLVGASGKGKP